MESEDVDSPQLLNSSDIFEETKKHENETGSQLSDEKEDSLHHKSHKSKKHKSKKLKKEKKREKHEKRELRKQRKLEKLKLQEEATTSNEITNQLNQIDDDIKDISHENDKLFPSVEETFKERPIEMQPDGAFAYFGNVLERLKKRKAKRQRLTTSESIDFVHGVLQQMKEARDADENALEERQPAVAKLQMLDYVAELLCKPKWRELFVSEGCCQALASWLAPYRDEKLPNVTIRKKMLQLIEKLPIQAQELQNSDLGAVLVTLWKHEDETEENRATIGQLIQRWMRPILGLGSGMKEYRMMQTMDAKKERIEAEADETPQEVRPAAAQLQVYKPTDKTNEIDTSKYRRAIPPRITGYNFVVQPKSDIQIDRQKLKKKPKSAFNKLLDASKLPKIPHQAHKVSIEGRDLH